MKQALLLRVVNGDTYVVRYVPENQFVGGNGVIGLVEEQEHYPSVRVMIGEKE
jgi:hydrogenase maturation factor